MITYNNRLLLIGSCFAQHIADKLDHYKFQHLANPFGTLFHPKAIEKLVNRALDNQEYSDDEIFYLNEGWHCFDTHSALSDPDKMKLIYNLNQALTLTNKQIDESTHIIITLGTAWVYREVKGGQIVANCHKVPQTEFTKELLSVEEIVDSLSSIIKLIRRVNNKAAVIFTVSPVRHLKDGEIENTLSKAHLIAGIHQLSEEGLFYFPSYEIMMDELRDYRYYDRDLVHPNELAIEYIWERFKQSWIDESSYEVMKKVEQLQKDLQHRPFNPASEQYIKFQERTAEKIKNLKEEFPFMSFDYNPT